MTVEEFLSRLDRAKPERPGQWIARCPAHDDGTASLGVKRGEDGRVLIRCLAGCKTPDVLKALHLDARALFPDEDRPQQSDRKQIVAQYPYLDERGELLYEVIRFAPKDFRQRKPDGKGGFEWKLNGVRRVPFRLPELLAADPAETVFVVEGEKDVETLRARGLVATSNPQGAGKWGAVADLAREVLRGRVVVALADNDDPGRAHAADVVASLRGAAKSARVLELPGLGKGGDATDWFITGGTVEQLRALAAAAPASDLKAELAGIDWGSFAERLVGEREERLELAKRMVPFEIAYLDDHLGGLMPEDLLLVTAKSGAGKTQLVRQLGENIARRGGVAVAFALEAARKELERRTKWNTIARFYTEIVEPRARARGEAQLYLSRRLWMQGKLDHVLGDMERSVDVWLKEQIGDRLITVYRGKSFKLEQTLRVMRAFQDRADLFIVDHLDYLDTDEENENASAKLVMDGLRDMALDMQKPVALVVHVKKQQGFRPNLVPQPDDIHGSSHIVKKCTIAIAIAPAPRMATDPVDGAPTFIQVLKDRLDGLSSIVARVNFNTRLGVYDDQYQLGRMDRNEKGLESWVRLADDRLPGWATRVQKRSVQTLLGGGQW